MSLMPRFSLTRFCWCGIALVCAVAVAPAAPATRACLGGVAAGTFRLKVRPASAGAALPIRQVNTMQAGYHITSETVQLPPEAGKNSRLTLVVLPLESGRAVTVLDPFPADGNAEWTLPFQPAAVLLLFGPQGVDEKRVAHLVSKDDDLVAELAGYADQTQELEANIDSLMAADSEDQDDPIARLRNGTPSEQALFTLVRALNPSTSSYNPLAGGRRAGPATTMGKAAVTFFDNAGGTFPGSGALPVMKTWLMPDTEFRTVYSEQGDNAQLTLCTQRAFVKTRNRMVYIWGYRVLNAPPPVLAVARATSLPLGARAPVPIKASVSDWNLVDRVREWALIDAAGKSVPVKARPVRRGLELDLRKTSFAPGQYRLQGQWDWQVVNVAGDFALAPLGDTARARVSAASEALLTEGAGVVPVRLEGADFQFVERVTLRRPNWTGWTPLDLDFALPPGAPRGSGPQPLLDVEIDTGRLRAGEYLLALVQAGGSTQEIAAQVLPATARIDNLPLKCGTGEGRQRIVLRGIGLDRLEAIEADAAVFQLAPGGTPLEREVTIAWKSAAVRPDDSFPIRLRIAGTPDPVTLPNALRALGPRPKITAAKVSAPEDSTVALREGELPAGSFAGVRLEATGADAQTALRLECSEAPRTLAGVRLRPGERTAAARFLAAGPGAYFAWFDPGAIGQPGCSLTAALESDFTGAGAPAALGRVVRLPRIEGFRFTEEKAGETAWVAVLRGRDLEVIERAGWDASSGLAVTAAPRTTAGEGDLQSLRIALPWPPPRPLAPLYLWLEGDTQGRLVKLKTNGER